MRVRRGGVEAVCAGALLLVGILGGGTACAQTVPPTGKPSYDPRTAFSETDTNHDGAIDREEFEARMTEVFYAADVNKDGTLSAEEVTVTLVQTENLTSADSNHDGKLTLHEFLRARSRDFEQTDTNGDGLLEVDEVVSVYEKRPQK
jgi:Ca2+-binding EF-hand superfamily protein